jgi:hypothetical protein
MHGTPDCLGDVVDILRLDDGFQVILQDASEVVLQVAASEVREDFLPIGGVLHRVAGAQLEPHRQTPLSMPLETSKQKLLHTWDMLAHPQHPAQPQPSTCASVGHLAQ